MASHSRLVVVEGIPRAKDHYAKVSCQVCPSAVWQKAMENVLAALSLKVGIDGKGGVVRIRYRGDLFDKVVTHTSRKLS